MTNGDRVRAMDNEDMALWFAKWTDCNECPSKSVFPRCAMSEESCACQWDEWLNSNVEDNAND